MKTIICLPKNIYTTDVVEKVKKIISSYGIDFSYVDSHDHYVKNNYLNIIKEEKNVVTWIFRAPHSIYAGKNVLYFDHGLLKQKNGLFCDDLGHWTDSSFVKSKEFSIDINEEDLNKLSIYMKSYFNFVSRNQFDKNGPILVALQTKLDCPTQFYFKHPLYDVKVKIPTGEFKGMKIASEDSVYNILYLCRKYLPNNVPVIVRPHPIDADRFFKSLHLYTDLFLPNWSIDKGESIYDIAVKCRSAVTINSTVATELMYIGIPVAVLGKGLFTGSGSVFDCSEDFSKLSNIGNYAPDIGCVNKYLCAILRNQLQYNSSYEDACNKGAIKRWIERVLNE